jgi:hypothetical protein
MYKSLCDVPNGGSRVVKRCSAQLVETFGPDGKCCHQELIIHRLPSDVPNMMTEAFFHPLRSHVLGSTTKMIYPSRCSNVILSTYVDTENPAVFRCGIRPFYNLEKHMNAQQVLEKLESAIESLESAKDGVNDNDTMEFDLGRKLNLLTELAEEVADYVADAI